MTKEDKYALKEFLTAVGVTASVFVVFIIILLVIINLSSGGEPLKSSVEVVDKYKECDIIRYAPHQVAEYKYFLYCGEKE